MIRITKTRIETGQYTQKDYRNELYAVAAFVRWVERDLRVNQPHRYTIVKLTVAECKAKDQEVNDDPLHGPESAA